MSTTLVYSFVNAVEQPLTRECQFVPNHTATPVVLEQQSAKHRKAGPEQGAGPDTWGRGGAQGAGPGQGDLAARRWERKQWRSSERGLFSSQSRHAEHHVPQPLPGAAEAVRTVCGRPEVSAGARGQVLR